MYKVLDNAQANPCIFRSVITSYVVFSQPKGSGLVRVVAGKKGLQHFINHHIPEQLRSDLTPFDIPKTLDLLRYFPGRRSGHAFNLCWQLNIMPF